MDILDLIRTILGPTAWEMEVAPAYGLLHLGFMIPGFVLSFFLAWKLRNLDDRKNRRLILGIGIFLLVCEVYKQLMYEVVIEPEVLYHWGNFPFHLCSIPMYLCLVIPVLKPGNVQRALYGFLATFNLLSGFIAFFEPSGLLHNCWTITFPSLIWHMVLVFLGAYVAFSGRGCITNRNFLHTCGVFGGLCLVAFAFNFGFQELSEQQLHAFFLGPAHSPIIVFSTISQMFGWPVCSALYILCVCAGAYLIHRIMGYVRKALLKQPVHQ